MNTLRVIFIATILAHSFEAEAQEDKWRAADKAVVRLKPSVFSQLPPNIVSYLQARGCTVPQSFGDLKPHNVIRGRFAKANRSDWAVLCSRRRVSTILVFWKGATSTVAKVARVADKNFLQVIDGNGGVGFSRTIDVVDKNYILRHHRDYAGKKPPQIRHHAINDAFFEKASTVHYFYRKRWLRLQGAD